MSKGNHITIDLNSGEELGVLPDRSKRSNPNPQISVDEAEPSRIKENPRRMSLEISFSSGEPRSHEEVSEGKPLRRI